MALSARETFATELQDTCKRVFDVIAASGFLLVLAPIMIAITILVRLDSRGPILFKQQRPGRYLQHFSMLKFRTMRDGSDKLAVATLREAEFGPLHKRAGDPRITRCGHFLRRFSLDELPQLINVLRGDMSLVGPRPLLGWELEGKEEAEAKRAIVRPGLTGLWQVSGRSNLSFDEMVDLDLFYVEHRSFALDLKILFKTLPAVLAGDGAY